MQKADITGIQTKKYYLGPKKAVAGAGYIQHFLKHWRTPEEEVGKLLRITLAWSQYHSGVPYSILSKPNKQLNYIPDRFIKHLRRHLATIGGSITIELHYTHQPLQANDKSIMHQAIDNYDFTDNELERINCVRMYLGVTFLSEISNIQGTTINNTPEADDHRNQECKPNTRLYQTKPNTKSWTLWNTVINSFTTNGKTIRTPVGQWNWIHSSKGVWKSYIHPDNDTIHICQPDHTWKKYNRHGINIINMQHDINFTPTPQHRPTTITTFRNGTEYYNPGRQHDIIAHRLSPIPSNWSALIQQQPPWIQQLVTSVKYDDLYTVITAIATKNLIAVSDGSAKTTNMTYGWILSTTKGQRIAKGNGPCNGRPSSMRSKAAGMLAISLFIGMIQEISQYPVYV